MTERMKQKLTLEPSPQAFAVSRLAAEETILYRANQGSLCSITRSPSGLSIVSEEYPVPDSIRSEGGFRCLRVSGPLAFHEAGIMNAGTAP